MSALYDIANKIDEFNCRFHCIKNILEVVAEDIQDPHSGAIWAAADSLEDLCKMMDNKISELMKVNREHNEYYSANLEKEIKKAKKK